MPNFLGWSEARLERYFNALYDGDFNAENLPPELYEAILDKLTEGVVKGFGEFGDDKTKAKIFVGLVDNLAVFSAAKTYQQINDMQNFLFDSSGAKRPYGEFKEAAGEIFDTYNNNWLKTEYNTAIGQSQSASDWADYERDKEALPLLKYETVGDERVRHDHQDLDGIIKPVGDPFWNENAPLNGFGCRCRLIQLEEGEETDLDELEKKLGRPIEKPDKLFRYNPGKDSLIFDESVHPYFKVDKRYKIAKKGGGIPVKQPPRKPKPVKKKLPPKVVPDTVAPGVFKSQKAAKDYIKNVMQAEAGVTVKSFSVSGSLGVEDFSRRVNYLAGLFKEYKIDPSVDVKNSSIGLSFKSGTSTLGQITHGKSTLSNEWRITKANFGHTNGSKQSSAYVKGDTQTRFNSAVDAENYELSTLTHEFAHLTTISELYVSGKVSDTTKAFWTGLSKIKKEYYAELGELALDGNKTGVYDIHLGRYANANIDEFLAEGFKEYKLRKKPSKYAQKIGELFDKHYKK